MLPFSNIRVRFLTADIAVVPCGLAIGKGPGTPLVGIVDDVSASVLYCQLFSFSYTMSVFITQVLLHTYIHTFKFCLSSLTNTDVNSHLHNLEAKTKF